MLENENVFRRRRAREPGEGRRRGERRRERAGRGKIEIGVAPLQYLHVVEAVALQRLHEILLERRAATGGAEGAVAHGAAGAPGDLRELGRIELAELIAV